MRDKKVSHTFSAAKIHPSIPDHGAIDNFDSYMSRYSRYDQAEVDYNPDNQEDKSRLRLMKV